jgi:very-short-patch-repair endonuclease
MHWSVVSVVFLAVALVIVFDRRRPGAAVWPVYARPVLTDPERVLYARLREAFPDRVVLPQVQICRFVEVKNVRNRTAVLNRYSRLSADFVICSSDCVPFVVVELDDASHQRSASRVRDAKKDAVLAAAGIRLLRWHVRSIPDVLAFGRSWPSWSAARTSVPRAFTRSLARARNSRAKSASVRRRSTSARYSSSARSCRGSARIASALKDTPSGLTKSSLRNCQPDDDGERPAPFRRSGEPVGRFGRVPGCGVAPIKFR